MQHVIKALLLDEIPVFLYTLPINVINAAVSADRAVLDNQTGIKFEFFGLAPWEARGKTWEKGDRKCKGDPGLWRGRVLPLS